ncbi:MAG: 30S ribosomal protein S17 [Candidatus Buchananbacteria bacterium CG10_big_fil_rev_8_21_14_0_10_42_9]|uniref:Small ribosomal subunit protein uS17 n=1 Tax=Candidatus Buchananbacteria bacterium CG10_big_fil_rev_8_21_14_0_10_42_9 TaxID=1974526 RepID=A0A2H0W4C7_9BACT|nr:MAG: 30S ribosomal protein S17 [Candidatus Buchananbacteria bacterium CG10_big_fil_rev_8_21_14_0_10_42_9]
MSDEKKSIKNIRKLTGVVVSDKQDKTIVVKVDRTKINPKYHKRFKISKKYHVDDSKNQFHTGDVVSFVAARPISKTKRWRVIYSK